MGPHIKIRISEAPCPTVSSDTCGVPISAADLYAAVARSPGGDSRCGEIIIVQFGDASVNLTVSATCPECTDSDIEMTQAAYTALGVAVGPVTVTWEIMTGGPVVGEGVRSEIRYVVRLEGRFAPAFRSLLGILAGDPGSPHLWNLFISDFILEHHPEDIVLNGVPISNIEHADDILTASSCPPGFQIHLNDSQSWADDNGCETSIPKCLYRIFGPCQKAHPAFHLGGKLIKQVQKACYLGLWFETGTSNIWREQYKVKAKKATTAANVLLGLDRFVGALPAWDMRTLYMARVDPYLIAGCEVCLDVNEKSLKLLEKVQCKFIRRMLGVGSRSLKAVLFSETGIWPIRYRRFILRSRICVTSYN
ncbi:hypothetical protein FB451DRAFT_1416102 [Mycena latifolia]|nr:hypothetical protein FB451DRAFT_1416102 [Mycena latifolia]